MLILDTGVIVAAADRADRHHSACAVLLEEAQGPLVTSPLVVAEAAYLISRELGASAEEALFSTIADGGLTVATLTHADWVRVRDLVGQYKDLPLGGTDAALSLLPG